MKVELKNVKYSPSLSEETNAFTADVLVDGVKCGYAKNNGHGGDTNVQPYPEKRSLFFQCEGWLKGQPQINIGSENDPYMVDCDMESMVDMLFEQWLKEGDKKKREKKMETCLMWGVPNGDRYTYVNFKTKLSLIPHNVLQDKITFYKRSFKEGEQFLNTNLEGYDL